MDVSQILDLMGEAISSGQLEFPIITVLVSADGVVIAARGDGTHEDLEILCEYPSGAETAKAPINVYFTDPKGNSVHAVLEKSGAQPKWVH